MLKPTERPPPSLQPRFAASITPGPPPVTTAKPACPKSRAVSRARSYGSVPSGVRAEPKIETAGRSISSTFWKPPRNSDAITATSFARSSCVRSRMRRSPGSTWPLDLALDEARAHPEREQRGEDDVGDADDGAASRGDAVVRLALGVPPVLPAAPGFEPAEDEDQDQDRVRCDDREPDERGQPDEPESGV